MPRFTKARMLDELRTIFLFEADHILMGAGEEMAERFIGFGPGEEGEYCHQDPALVDLSRFSITPQFEAGYDFAFRPSLMNARFDGSDAQDLITFMSGTPRAGGVSSGGERHPFMEPEGLCQSVADAALARLKLEFPTEAMGDFTTRELALLADMSEGAIRNALADKSEAGLRAIKGSKNPVQVETAEAWRWLQGRRGFIPSPERPIDDRFLTRHLQELRTAREMGALIRGRLVQVWPTGRPSEDEVGLTETTLKLWCDGAQTYDEAVALRLAERLGFDAPLFAGKALEVLMRRDREEASTA